MTNIDNRTIANEADNNVLKALHKFGWLTPKMLSALLWRDATQGEAMARRTLRRLLDKKHVLKRQSDGNALWVLSAAGARVLQEQYDLDASSGQTLKLAQNLHRACANWHSIYKMNEGFGVWTEYEIQTGRAPCGRLDGKTADFVIDSEQGLIFGEVENAYKNRARRAAIASLCRRHLSPRDGVLTPLAGGHHLIRVEIVSTNEDALRLMLQTFVEEFDSGLVTESQLSCVMFTLLPVSESLSPGTGWTRELWADILLPMLGP